MTSGRWVLCLALAAACGGPRSPLNMKQPPAVGEACVAQPATPRRLVRLSLNQAATAIGQLLGPDAEAAARGAAGVDPALQTFVELASPREGSSLGPAQLTGADAMAQAAAQRVS